VQAAVKWSVLTNGDVPMFRLAATLFALSLFAPPLSGQSQDRPIRAGIYDLAITFGGGNLEATLEIGYKGDSITTVLKLGDHDSPVKPGKRTGGKLTLEPASPAMNVKYELEFNADEVKGTFVYDGQNGELKGKRRRQER
jgi:hypothetical protein